MQEFLNDLKTFVTTTGVDIANTVTVFVLGLLAVRIIIYLANRLLLKGNKDKTVIKFGLSIFRVGLYLLWLLGVATAAGISTQNFVTVLSAIVLAVGLALKDSLSNLANGFIVVGTKPFVEGDYVSVNGVEGTVRAIGMFNTKLVATDNKVITVPNSQIIGNEVINFSTSSTRRLNLTFSISYDDDVEKAKKILTDIASRHEKVLSDPAPMARLMTQNQSSLDLVLRAWVPTSCYWDAYFDITESVLQDFKACGINIPYPQMDVHIVDKGGKQ